MKKITAVLLLVLFATMILTSCSGSPKSVNEMWGGSSGFGYDGEAPAAPPPELQRPGSIPGDMDYNDALYDTGYTNTSTSSGQSDGGLVTAGIVDSSFTEKIIYTASADIETVDFDATIEGVYSLLTNNGGFVENSNIGGRNYAQSYHGWQTFRNAQFTLRIPKDRLNAVTASLATLGNVTSLKSNAENITAQFFDTESRLNSYRTQEERLLNMLSKTDNVTDMISIEERLADIRYQIESLTSTLRNWQSSVDYSTLNLYINEVETFSEIETVQYLTYWQQIGDGLETSTRSVGRFFMELFKGLVINLPVIVILAVIVVIIIIVIKRQARRNAKRIKQNPQNPQYPPNPYNQQYPQYPQNPPPSQNPPYQQNPENQQAPHEQNSQKELQEQHNQQNPQDNGQ